MLSDALVDSVENIKHYSHSDVPIYVDWYSKKRAEINTLLRLMDQMRKYYDRGGGPENEHLLDELRWLAAKPSPFGVTPPISSPSP